MEVDKKNHGGAYFDAMDDVQTSTMLNRISIRNLAYGMAVVVGLLGCTLLDPAEDIPTYLIVDGLNFTPTPEQGTASIAVTDVWAYSTTDVLGIFPLPAIIPIFPQDHVEGPVRLLPGIRENGISDSRSPYPFYTAMDVDIDGAPGERDTLQLSFSWVDDVHHLSVEDFENSNVFSDESGTAAVLERVTNAADVFEGDGSARVVLTPDASLMRARTLEQEYQIQSGVPVFLEMNYRCDQGFLVGLYAFRNGASTRYPALVLSSTVPTTGADAEWNKVYVDLSTVVGANPNADHFEVYFECLLADGSDRAEIGLDNLRILTY